MTAQRGMRDYGTVFLSLIFLGAIGCEKRPYVPVPRNYVYHIKQHNDSLYFSTLNSGMYRFHPDRPESVRRVGGRGNLPFRSFVFLNDTLLASSYHDGMYRAVSDTMVPFSAAPYPAWSVKLDEDNNLWLAGTRGIWRQNQGAFQEFNSRTDAHDIAFYNGTAAVAHGKGITIFDKQSGRIERELAKGVVCWTVKTYDSLLIGGGQNHCYIIGNDTSREFLLGPSSNALWDTERDGSGIIYCGTQQGLYRIDPASNTVACIGSKGVCIKSLCLDSKGRLWAGRFGGKRKWDKR